MKQNETQTLNTFIPKNIEGKPLDLHERITLPGIELAANAYDRACKRLLNPAIWQQLAGWASADFMLTSNGEDAVERLAEVNDFIRINIPGPGPKSGDGFDWVKIMAIEQNVTPHADKSLGIMLSPTSNPNQQETGTAHFFKSDASSTFIIQQNGNSVDAFYFGRNEIPNIKAVGFWDSLRNGIVAAGAFLGYSSIQWDGLLKGLLSAELGKKPSIKPKKKQITLTAKALEMLMDCHERELLNLDPCDTYHTQVARGLIIKGFFTTQMYTSPATGKSYMAFYITEAGKKYLEKYVAK